MPRTVDAIELRHSGTAVVIDIRSCTVAISMLPSWVVNNGRVYEKRQRTPRIAKKRESRDLAQDPNSYKRRANQKKKTK